MQQRVEQWRKDTTGNRPEPVLEPAARESFDTGHADNFNNRPTSPSNVSQISAYRHDPRYSRGQHPHPGQGYHPHAAQTPMYGGYGHPPYGMHPAMYGGYPGMYGMNQQAPAYMMPHMQQPPQPAVASSVHGGQPGYAEMTPTSQVPTGHYPQGSQQAGYGPGQDNGGFIYGYGYYGIGYYDQMGQFYGTENPLAQQEEQEQLRKKEQEEERVRQQKQQQQQEEEQRAQLQPDGIGGFGLGESFASIGNPVLHSTQYVFPGVSEQSPSPSPIVEGNSCNVCMGPSSQA